MLTLTVDFIVLVVEWIEDNWVQKLLNDSLFYTRAVIGRNKMTMNYEFFMNILFKMGGMFHIGSY